MHTLPFACGFDFDCVCVGKCVEKAQTCRGGKRTSVRLVLYVVRWRVDANSRAGKRNFCTIRKRVNYQNPNVSSSRSFRIDVISEPLVYDDAVVLSVALFRCYT